MDWGRAAGIAADLMGVAAFFFSFGKALFDKWGEEEMLNFHFRLVRAFASGQPYALPTPASKREHRLYRRMVKAGLLKPSGTGGFQPIL
jgi:hypothetical protein